MTVKFPLQCNKILLNLNLHSTKCQTILQDVICLRTAGTGGGE